MLVIIVVSQLHPDKCDFVWRHVATYTGLSIDSVEQVVFLPADKTYRLLGNLRILEAERRMTCQVLQEFLGIIAYSCMICPFLRHLIAPFYSFARKSDELLPATVFSDLQVAGRRITSWLTYYLKNCPSLGLHVSRPLALSCCNYLRLHDASN